MQPCEFEVSASVQPASRQESTSSAQSYQWPRAPTLYPSLSTELRPDEMPDSRFAGSYELERLRERERERSQPLSTASTESAASATTALQLQNQQEQLLQPKQQQQQQERQTVSASDAAIEASVNCAPEVSLSDPPSLEQVSSASCDEVPDANREFDDTSFHYLGRVQKIQFKKLDPSLALVCTSTVTNLFE